MASSDNATLADLELIRVHDCERKPGLRDNSPVVVSARHAFTKLAPVLSRQLDRPESLRGRCSRGPASAGSSSNRFAVHSGRLSENAIREKPPMNRKACATLACLAAVNVAHAHHGIANFDLNADIELEGTITRVEFLNPHSWLYLDVANDDGEVTAWRCELRGGTVLKRSGWSEEMFPSGLEITVTGSPDRRDPTTCYLGTAIFPDGSSIDRYGQLKEATPVAPADRPARLANGDPNIAGRAARSCRSAWPTGSSPAACPKAGKPSPALAARRSRWPRIRSTRSGISGRAPCR
jgi:hypothetical protein